MSPRRIGLFILIGFTLWHLIALPLAIPYDGHEYLDLAQVLFSERFPADWDPPIRTPGYPFLLRLSFWAFGVQPMAVLAMGALASIIGILCVAATVERIAGEKAAAVSICALSFYPLQIAYAHSALTEIYVFAILSAVTLVAVIPVRNARMVIAKGIILGLLIAAGYHIRQTMLVLAPAAALVLMFQAWKDGLRVALIAAILTVSLPLAAKAPFDRYVNNPAVQTYMLRQGMIRQALIPEEHPFIVADKDKYNHAVAASGNMLSGMRTEFVGQLAETVYPRMGEPFSDFFNLVFANPWRYGSALARTTALYIGLPAEQTTNRSTFQAIFEINEKTNPIAPGNRRVETSTRSNFTQLTAPHFGKIVLNWMMGPFETIVIISMASLFLMPLFYMFAGGKKLLIMATIPIAFLAPQIAILASEDRYAFPAYPIALGFLIAVVTLFCRKWSGAEQPSQTILRSDALAPTAVNDASGATSPPSAPS